MNDPEYTNPTPEDLKNPVFEAIWQAIKGWDISRYNDGLYSGPTGNDVMHILNKIHEPPMNNNDTPSTQSPTESDEHKWDVTTDKQLRKDLDASLQNLKELKASRERALAKTKLQEAIMWLGMDLKRLHEPNPYPESYNPNNTVIAPTADGLTL